MASPEIIDISDDPESIGDEEVHRAVTIINQRDRQGAHHDEDEILAAPSVSPPAEVISAASSTGAVFGGLFLDRKKMEEERLARLRGQKRSADSPPSTMPPSRRAKLAEAPSTPMPNTESRADAKQSSPAGGVSNYFPRGAIKRTWALGYERTGDDIKFEEVLQKNQVQLAILASFQWDDDWLLAKIDITRTKLLCIAYAENEAQREQMRANVPPHRIHFCFPPVYGIGKMHAKIQLLKYPQHLRVVIPTGNLTAYDWGETGVLENMLFIIDLPKIDSKGDRTPSMKFPRETQFGREMTRFLGEMGVSDKMVAGLDRYDFAETARYGFIHTISGSQTGHDRDSTGYGLLGRTVEEFGLSTEKPVEVDFLCSSLGNLNTDFLSAIYNAAQGESGMQEYNQRLNKNKNKRVPKDSRWAQSKALVRDHFRVFFPSDQTVSQSRGGKNSAGTICFQRSWWSSPTFPQEILRDYESHRNRLLLHTKFLFVRRPGAAKGAQGWAYLGSANLSESAWGRLVKDKENRDVKMSCRNWECGVLIPSDKQVDEGAPGDIAAVFGSQMPLPAEFPGTPYSQAAEKKPWFFV